jgi:uncharacterized membrane protein YciS (DUF1049 family)
METKYKKIIYKKVIILATVFIIGLAIGYLFWGIVHTTVQPIGHVFNTTCAIPKP